MGASLANSDDISQDDSSPEELQRLSALAGQVVSNNHLYMILSEADPSVREAVYERIKPFLRFKPRPFWQIMNKPIQ